MILSEAIQATRQSIDDLYPPAEADNISRYYFEDKLGHTMQDYLLSKSELANWEEDVARLQSGVPLQYVTGVAHFYGHAFLVSPSVLIPRPETEELVRQVTIAARAMDRPLRILDIGTGSGCIAISIKKELPAQVMVTGVDKSDRALINAIDNSQLLDAHVMMRACDALDPQALQALGTFDIVVSNPPYIPPSEAKQMPRHVRNHEPDMALFVPEQDPLLFYRTILNVPPLLADGGQYFFEINEHLGSAMSDLAAQVHPSAEVEVLKDLQGKDRMLHIRLV